MGRITIATRFPCSRIIYMTKTLSWTKTTSSVLLVLLGGGISVGSNYLINSPKSLANGENQTNRAATITRPGAIAVSPNYVSNVVNRVGNTVVRIDAVRKVATNVPSTFNDPDPSLKQFFGSPAPNIPREQTQKGMGSGFVVSSDGLILTNAHVVEGSDRVKVTLKDGQTYQGRVMGTDSLTDVAVIKIEADSLPAVTFADSDQLQPGESAIAIGNPLGLDNTVTNGIVSATARTSAQVGVADKRVSFIQTDAAINPGNSGGPLLNAQGEVIGINTAIMQNAQGLGFAIPGNAAKDIAEELIATGKVDHPFLGIQMAQITPELKQELKTQKNLQIDPDGIVIVGVVPNSPADRAGIKSGDVIQAIDQQKITTIAQVQQAVAKINIGEKLNLGLMRNDRQLDLALKVALLPQSKNFNR